MFKGEIVLCVQGTNECSTNNSDKTHTLIVFSEGLRNKYLESGFLALFQSYLLLCSVLCLLMLSGEVPSLPPFPPPPSLPPSLSKNTFVLHCFRIPISLSLIIYTSILFFGKNFTYFVNENYPFSLASPKLKFSSFYYIFKCELKKNGVLYLSLLRSLEDDSSSN